MAIPEDATPKDFTLILYDKTEIDSYRTIEEARIDDALIKKSDKVDEGSPSGIATLNSSGQHVINQIPVASQSESESITVNDKLMTPERTNQHLQTNGYIKSSEADIVYGNLRSDGSTLMDSNFNPQNLKDIATVEYVQDSVSSNTTTYVVDTLAEMLSLDPIIVGDICFVSNDVGDPTNEGEYLATVDVAGGTVIENWAKRNNDVVYGSFIGDMVNQTDLDGRFVAIETKTDNITVTQTANLDTMQIDIDNNTAKVSYTDASDVAASKVITDQITITAPVNLDNIDADTDANTSSISTIDAEQIVQDNRLDVIEGPQTKINFSPSDGGTQVEGDIFYDDVAKTLAIVSDIAGTTLNVGQELYIRVYNPSASIIPNGSNVHEIGVQGGYTSVDLAIATSFEQAIIIGISTADIAPGTFGYATTFGNARDIPTNQNGETWITGDILYLSDVIAGGMTNIRPPVASISGQLLTSNGATGTMLVKARSLITLPPVGGWMKVIPTTIAPGGGLTNFTGFTDVSVSAGIIADGVIGSYTIENGGTYQLSLSVSFSNITGQNNGSIIRVEIFNATTALSLFGYNVIVGRNDEVASGSFTTQEDFDVGDIIVARYSEISGNVGGSVVVDDIAFLVSSILIRNTL